MRPELVRWEISEEIENSGIKKVVKNRSMHPAASEIVGHRLMKELGFRSVAQVKVSYRDELGRYNPKEWIVKSVSMDPMGPRLKCVTFAEAKSAPAYQFVLVAKIPKSVPLNYLRYRYGISGAELDLQRSKGFPTSDALQKLDWSFLPPFAVLQNGGCAASVSLICDKISGCLSTGNKVMPTDGSMSYAEFYSDFVAPEDWTAIKSAIAWNSDQMLAIHAARLFLGCTTAHSGNILVDSDGNLSAIDFEFCVKTDGEELRQLFENVQPRTRAFDALRGVATLTDAKIFRLFDGLPSYFKSPLGSAIDVQLYFVKRLHLWKTLFEKGDLAC